MPGHFIHAALPHRLRSSHKETRPSASQWLAQHYRGLHAPGLLSPDILQPAGLQSCSHCHKVFTQGGGMSRHENLCEDRPDAIAPTPPPN